MVVSAVVTVVIRVAIYTTILSTLTCKYILLIALLVICEATAHPALEVNIISRLMKKTEDPIFVHNFNMRNLLNIQYWI